MLLKILFGNHKVIRADEKEVVIKLTGPEEPVIMTTHYQEGKPEIQKLRLFVTDYGRIKRGA
jgi:hypothetical protein